MGRTIGELEAALTPREFAEWAAFDRLEPIGGRRGDWHAALVATTIANVNRGKRRPWRLDEFLLFAGRARSAAAKGRKSAAGAMKAYFGGKAS